MHEYLLLRGFSLKKEEENFALYEAELPFQAKIIITETKDNITYMYLYDKDKKHINTYAKIGNEVGSVYHYKRLPKLTEELLKNNKIAKEVL